jgi:hypothetical protein
LTFSYYSILLSNCVCVSGSDRSNTRSIDGLFIPPTVGLFFIPTIHHCECSNHFQSHASIARTHPRSASLVHTQNCPALDVQQTISIVYSSLLYGICHMTKIMFDLAVTAFFAHRVTVKASLLAPIRQSAADVSSIMSRVFLHIECAILFLLAQGCHNDIKKPSCLISCD